MKPLPRTLKQRGRDERFLAELRSLFADPLRQRLANRVRSGELVPTMLGDGALAFQFVLDSEFLKDFCHRCGCTQNAACEGGCAWARPGLCTACLTGAERKTRAGWKGIRERALA